MSLSKRHFARQRREDERIGLIAATIANSSGNLKEAVKPSTFFPYLAPPAQGPSQVLQELLRGMQVLGKHPDMTSQPEAVEQAMRDFAASESAHVN